MLSHGKGAIAVTLIAAGVGGWTLDPAAGLLDWTALTFALLDLDPGVAPSLEQALGYFAMPGRHVLRLAVKRCLRQGESWDLELPVVTAKGRAIWVRVCGRAVRQEGQIVQIVGALQDVTARHDLAAEAERLSLVVRQTTNGVVITDCDGRVEWVNEAFERMTQYSLADMKGRRPAAFLQGPETDPATIRQMAACLRRGEGFDIELVNYRRDGVPYWVSIACTPIHEKTGVLTGFIAVENDITRRKQAEAERQKAEALLRDIVDTLPMAVSAYDQDERLILVNRGLCETLPVLAQFAVPGRPLADVLRLATAAGQFPQAGTTADSRDAWSAENLAVHRRADSTRTLQLPGGHWVQARERRSANGNLVSVRTDMTELKRAEAALRIQAERDGLTQLANRAAMMQALEALLAPRGGSTGQGGALVLLDVDYFKQVNDTAGHDTGDALLVEIATRLRAATRGNDTPARLGGDEFAVLLPGLTNIETAEARIGQMHAALSRPADCLGHHLHIGVSAGVTLFPADGVQPERLMKNADLALYEAKRTGRGRWCRYRPEQANSMERHVHLASALRQALAGGRIQAALQPKRRLRGGHDGFEVLARWHDGTHFVPPGEFVPVAEESGQMLALGRQVMDAGLARLAALRGMGLQPGRLAFNISGMQLLHDGFRDEVLAALQRHGLGPETLEFELTESVLTGRSIERVEQILQQFRALGVALTLDDFGTGFASLAHVARLPIQTVKIDRAFTGGIGRAGRGGIIARAVIGLAHGMDMEATAVGVETPEQLAFLEAEGCDAVQGYLIAPPLATLDEAAAYLDRGSVKVGALYSSG
jgi:diguanylate cyclase (GGDEF)-like protein/PAS domain S-box-containing protein